MATKIKITDEYVMFTVEGLPEAEKKTVSTLSRITRAITSTAAISKVAFGAVGIAAGLMWKGFSGTREGDQFANSMTYLARVVANEAAPALRVVTVAIVSFADALRSMSPEMKTALGVAAALGVVLTVLGTGPFALAVTGAVALATALVATSNSAEQLANRLKMLFTPLMALDIFNQLPEQARRAIGTMMPLLPLLDKLNKKAGDPMKGLAERLFGVKEAVKDVFKAAGAAGGIHIKVAAELEGPQQTWERIQKAFAESRNELNPKLDEHLGGIGKKIDAVIDAVKGAGGGIGK